MSQLKMNILQIGSNADPTKNFIIKTPAAPDGSLEIRRGNYDAPGALVAVINSDGTIGVQAGAKFPAAQVASSDPNTLDDYEEGSWTPALTFGGAAVGLTYSVAKGRYVKVGKFVTVLGYLSLSNKGSSAGQAVIGGLPFAADNSANAAPFTCGSFWLYGMSALSGGPRGYISSGGSTVLVAMDSATGGAPVTNTNFTNGSEIMFTLTYEAAQ